MLGEKIGVWWDINTCPVPKEIDVRSVRSRIEWALNKSYGYRPITIFCVGNLERVDPRVLEELSSSGIILRHVPFGWATLCDHLRDWKKRNVHGAPIMLISGDICWFTGPWFNSSILSLRFTLLRAFPAPRPPSYPSWREWVWEALLLTAKNPETNSQAIPPEGGHALFCTLCNIPSQSSDDFIEHLKSNEHRLEFTNSMLAFVDENNDVINQCKLLNYPGLDIVDLTIPWTGRDLSQNVSRLSVRTFNNRILNQRSNIPRVFSKTTGVWWDINTCPIPKGYDPRRVRSCIESVVQAYIGHASPVTIFCVGNLDNMSPRVLKEISSSGILLRTAIFRGISVFNLLHEWQERSPPPAKIMLISADKSWFDYSFFSCGYTILRALPDPQSFPSCTSTHAWSWELLLKEESDLADTNSCLSSQLEDTKDEPDSWFCTVCEIPSQSCDDFINHLKSASHSEGLWDMVYVDKNNNTRFCCKICNYPGYDYYNMKIHWTSEEHAQKAKEDRVTKEILHCTNEEDAQKVKKTEEDRVTKQKKPMTKAKKRRVRETRARMRDNLTKKMESACMD